MRCGEVDHVAMGDELEMCSAVRVAIVRAWILDQQGTEAVVQGLRGGCETTRFAAVAWQG